MHLRALLFLPRSCLRAALGSEALLIYTRMTAVADAENKLEVCVMQGRVKRWESQVQALTLTLTIADYFDVAPDVPLYDFGLKSL